MAWPSARPEPASAAPASAAPRRSSVRASWSCGSARTCGSQVPISAAPASACSIGLVVAVEDVQRLRAVRERVHRGPAALAAGKVERQPRLVDDPGEVGASAAALRPRRGVARPEVGRPLGAGIRRRDGDERQPGRGGDRLGSVDRASAAQRHETVGPRGLLGGGFDARPLRVRLRAVEAAGDGKIERAPAFGGDRAAAARCRPLRARRAARRAPSGRSRVRPGEGEELVRGPASEPAPQPGRRRSAAPARAPSRVAAASVPAASSPSIAVREMNVTP